MDAGAVRAAAAIRHIPHGTGGIVERLIIAGKALIRLDVGEASHGLLSPFCTSRWPDGVVDALRPGE